MKFFCFNTLLFLFFTSSIRSQSFELLTDDHSGISFSNKLIESAEDNIITYEYFYNGGGVAAGDFNNDGLTDLIFTSNQENTALYINRGNLKFEEISIKAGINNPKGWKTGIALADVNDDGWLDIYISYSGNYSKKNRRNKLFINQKNLTFKDEAKSYGVDDFGYSSQSCFFDYDKDGDLDLFVINHNTKLYRNFDAAFVKKQLDDDAGDRLYENIGAKFVDVTQKAGIISNPIGYGLGVVVTDVNGDGWPDLYVSNDYIEQDYLYINNQDGTFRDELKAQIPNISNFSMGVDAGDINNDGHLDLITLDMLPEDNKRQKLLFAPDNFELYNNAVNNGFHHQSMRNMLQLNNANGTFSDIGQLAGISATDWSWAPLLADFNNDGYLDLYITNGYGRDMISRDVMKFYFNERLKFIEGKSDKKMYEALKGIPSTPLQNYYYVNNGNLSFEDRTADEGFEGKDFSHGAIYSDLDNDGDLEIIVNCMNEKAKVFKNLTVEKKGKANFISIKLIQKERNRNALGSKIIVYTNKGEQLTREVNPTHGFQSSVLEPIHFGLGSQTIDSIRVVWNDLSSQIIDKNITINQPLEIVKSKTTKKWKVTKEPLFIVKYDTLDYKHEELLVNDFKVQSLMPYMVSYHGPKIKKIDINNDQLDDLFIGGPEGQAPSVLIQSIDGRFFKLKQPYLEQSSGYEDTNACFFDADSDGDLDLYIVSGGFGSENSGIALEDRFYFNERGIFLPSNNLPKDRSVGSVAVPWDFDQDGDLDLFVGSRLDQAKFPKPSPSLILINDGKGNFYQSDHDFLHDLGLVTDAVAKDFDGDGKEELLITGDWTYPKVYNFENNHFVEKTSSYFSKNLHGWWSTINVNDLDDDGDLDVVMGNWGTNNHFKPNEKEPMELYYDDFDSNGYIDPIWCYYIQGKSYPNVLRDELTDQIISLRKRYVTYEEYADKTVYDIFNKSQIDKASKLITNFLETVWFENVDGKFVIHHLPNQANFSSVNAILIEDLDQDGTKDLFLAGNTKFNRVRIGKCEASYGVFLKGNEEGGFEYIPNYKTQISFKGAVRSLLMINTKGNKKLVAGINNSNPIVVDIKKLIK